MSILKIGVGLLNRLLKSPNNPLYTLRFVKFFFIHIKKINLYQASIQDTPIPQLVNLVWKKFFCSRRIFLNNEYWWFCPTFHKIDFPPYFLFLSFFLVTFPSLLLVIVLIFSSCSQLGSVCKERWCFHSRKSPVITPSLFHARTTYLSTPESKDKAAPGLWVMWIAVTAEIVQGGL